LFPLSFVFAFRRHPEERNDEGSLFVFAPSGYPVAILQGGSVSRNSANSYDTPRPENANLPIGGFDVFSQATDCPSGEVLQ
jgi:hypothetical protein